MKCSATAAAWFSTFFEKPLVKRVKRRIPIHIVRLVRSTCDVLMWAGSELPMIGRFSIASTTFMLLRRAVGLPSSDPLTPVVLDQLHVINLEAAGRFDGFPVGHVGVGNAPLHPPLPTPSQGRSRPCPRRLDPLHVLQLRAAP